MEPMVQWKAFYVRADGSSGRVYLEPGIDPADVALMDSILRWDTGYRYLQVDAVAAAGRPALAKCFFELNHITGISVHSLDEEIDATSDA